MAEADEPAKLRNYLRVQSAEVTAAEIRARLDEAAGELPPGAHAQQVARPLAAP